MSLVMINLLIKDEIYFLHLKDEQFEGSFKEIGESHCTTNTS
jgi:hypothetical protein